MVPCHVYSTGACTCVYCQLIIGARCRRIGKPSLATGRCSLNTVVLAAFIPPITLHITSQVLPLSHFPIMSQTPTTAAASSRFQVIFQTALKSYQKLTKNDLLAHPLASQLQSCNLTTAILTILQDQVREFDKSRSGDERLTKWLGPTVNILSAFSATISGGVILVGL